ncbi:Retrotransposon gag protein [Corchorus olitorius]|uniref:Retrotransposon gag protein n=1 Tax=Corchorus olitorius TaxID=93759 RepID=A0A1R3HCE1_9ROSI|nr:Retrotransposon gag protein [Corchorus olitorius]
MAHNCHSKPLIGTTQPSRAESLIDIAPAIHGRARELPEILARSQRRCTLTCHHTHPPLEKIADFKAKKAIFKENEQVPSVTNAPREVLPTSTASPPPPLGFPNHRSILPRPGALPMIYAQAMHQMLPAYYYPIHVNLPDRKIAEEREKRIAALEAIHLRKNCRNPDLPRERCTPRKTNEEMDKESTIKNDQTNERIDIFDKSHTQGDGSDTGPLTNDSDSDYVPTTWLKTASIVNFDHITLGFLSTFHSRVRTRKAIDHLTLIKQGPNESLKPFTKWFSDACLEIDDSADEDAIKAYMKGVKDEHLFYALE